MTAMAANQDELLTELLGELAGKIEAVDAGDRDANLKTCQEVLKECKKTLLSLRVETRGLPSDDKPRFEAALKQHKVRIQQLEGQMAQKKEQRRAIAGTSGGGGGGGAYSGDEDADDGRQDVRDAFGRIGNHQNDALEALGRINVTVERTKEVGAEAAEELLRQRRMIEEIDDKLDELGDDVTRAKRELNAFVRRMATDKLILCFMFLIVLGIVVAIIMKLVVGGDDDGNSPVPTPAP